MTPPGARSSRDRETKEVGGNETNRRGREPFTFIRFRGSGFGKVVIGWVEWPGSRVGSGSEQPKGGERDQTRREEG